MTRIQDALAATDEPLLVTHRHADRDSLGSALGLRALLGHGTICTPDGVARPAQSLLEATATEPVERPDETSYDAIVVLDSPSSERIAPIDPADPIVVDHHEPADLASRARAACVDQSAGATAELVARLAADAGWSVGPDAALPLVVGLLDDTDFLADASGTTIETAVSLVGALGERAEALPPLLDRSPRDGERTASALATLRATGYRAGDLVVAISHVGGYETAGAKALRSAGVDLALVCSEQSTGLRVSARASERVVSRCHLGSDLLPALATEFGGDGGGHAGAGVAHLDGGTRTDVDRFVREYLEDELGVTFAEI